MMRQGGRGESDLKLVHGTAGMVEWEEYRNDPLGAERRWQRTGLYADEVRVQDMLFSDVKAVCLDERYHVRYKPARSDTVTTVPNGRFATPEDAYAFAIETVMDGNIQYLDEY